MLHFCIRGAPARGDPAGRAGTPPLPHAPFYTRLPNPSTPQLRAVKARVCQAVQVHRRSAGADAGRKRERVDDDEPVSPIMYWRGPELQEAGSKGKFVCSQRCTASKNNVDCRLAWRGTPHRRLCLVGDTASHSVLLSVPASLWFHSVWLSVTAQQHTYFCKEIIFVFFVFVF